MGREALAFLRGEGKGITHRRSGDALHHEHALAGEVGKADADFVREATGYAIGGVSPVGHPEATVLLVDRDLFRFETIWAAAGHPHAVFPLTPTQLVDWLGVEAEDVRVD